MRRMAIVILVACFVAGCGSTGKPVVQSHPALLSGPASCTPAPGTGVMGACNPKPTGLRQAPARTLAGCAVPDVSEYQGYPNWVQARGHMCGVVVRAGDGRHRDRSLAYNQIALTHLGIYHAYYYFLRPGGCAGEARTALAWIGRLTSGPLIGDAEVPLNQGCVAAFEGEAEHLTGLASPVYSSAGTYPGGARPNSLEWDAAYGPVAGCFLCRGHRVAWQHTDGQIGAYPRCIPGIGCGDVSRDEGLTGIVRHLPPSRGQLRAQLHRELHLRDVLWRLLARHECRPGQHAKPPSYHTVCGRWLREGAEANRAIGDLRHRGA